MRGPRRPGTSTERARQSSSGSSPRSGASRADRPAGDEASRGFPRGFSARSPAPVRGREPRRWLRRISPSWPGGFRTHFPYSLSREAKAIRLLRATTGQGSVTGENDHDSRPHGNSSATRRRPAPGDSIPVFSGSLKERFLEIPHRRLRRLRRPPGSVSGGPFYFQGRDVPRRPRRRSRSPARASRTPDVPAREVPTTLRSRLGHPSGRRRRGRSALLHRCSGCAET